jgi:hypothetical protein
MSYSKVRIEILNYVERKRDAMSNDIKAMEVGHFDDYHYEDWDWWQDDAEYEQLNYFQKGGKGGKGGKGKGYYYYGGKGGYEKGTGKGKGSEDRGGKGGYEKGEGKGKGFQGECNWCGTLGHTASKRMKKDRHMKEYRQANGIPDPVWPPTGKGGLHSFEDIAEKPTKITKSTTSESPEMALDAMQSELQSDEGLACPRGLCNTREEELPPGLWPRLQECYPRTNEKKTRSENSWRNRRIRVLEQKSSWRNRRIRVLESRAGTHRLEYGRKRAVLESPAGTHRLEKVLESRVGTHRLEEVVLESRAGTHREGKLLIL